MVKKSILLLLLLPVLLKNQNSFCQSVDPSSFTINTRLSFYSFEKNGELLLHIPSGMLQTSLSVDIKVKDETIASWKGKAGKNILRLPFPVNLTPAAYKITATIAVSANPML